MQRRQRKISCKKKEDRHDRNIDQQDQLRENLAVVRIEHIPPRGGIGHVRDRTVQDDNQDHDKGAQVIKEIQPVGSRHGAFSETAE